MRRAMLIVTMVLLAMGCSSKVTSQRPAGLAVLPAPRAAARERSPLAFESTVATRVRCEDVQKVAPHLKGPLPVYPRATEIGSGPDGPHGGFVRELASDDSYDRVYQWYKQVMAPASEHRWQACVKIPLPSMMLGEGVALFSVGKLGQDYRAVFIVGTPRDASNARMEGWPRGKKLPSTIIALKVR